MVPISTRTAAPSDLGARVDIYDQANIALLRKFGFQQWPHLPGVAGFDDRQVGHLYYGLRVP